MNTKYELSIFNQIKLSIEASFTNENPYESSDVEIFVYIMTNENRYLFKDFKSIDDLQNFLNSEVEDENDSICAKIDKIIDALEADLEHFESEACSQWKKDEYDAEAKADRDELNREYWASR